MNPVFRRYSIGIISGAAASTVLTTTLHHAVWSLILGVVTGAVYCADRQPARRAYIDNLMTGGSLGVPLWSLISVIAVPLLSGQMPEWTAEQIRQHFPALVGWVVYGASLGIIRQGLDDIAERSFGPELAPQAHLLACVRRSVWKKNCARTSPPV